MNKNIVKNLDCEYIDNVSPQILPHQLATIDFLYRSCIDNKNSVLLFHKMGSGKTMISLLFSLLISIDKEVEIVLPNNSILSLWAQQLNHAISLLPNKPYKVNNINFITKATLSENISNDINNIALNKADKYENKIIIIDEAHNLFGNRMGDLMIKLRRMYNVIYILLTGSPITNTVDTLKYIIEMLTDNDFDTTKYINVKGTKVYQKFLNEEGAKYIKETLQDRVSYYNKELQSIPKIKFIGDDFFVYPIYKCKMSKLQADNYRELNKEAKNDMFIKLLMNASLCALGSRNNYDSFVNLVESGINKELLPNLYINNGLLYGKELTDLNISIKLKKFRNSLFKHPDIGKRFVYFANSYIGSVVIRSVMMANGISEYGKEVVNNFACVICVFKRACKNCIPMKFSIITSRETSKGNYAYINDIINIYNEDINDKGYKLLILFGSKIISEAYTLKEVRDVWFLTVPETKSEMTQFISRAVRTFSHKESEIVVLVRICVAVFEDENELEKLKSIDTFKGHIESKNSRTLSKEIIDALEAQLNTNYDLTYDLRKLIYLITKADRAHVIDVTLKSLNKNYSLDVHKDVLETYVVEKIRRYAYTFNAFLLDEFVKLLINYMIFEKHYLEILENILLDHIVVNNKDKGKCILLKDGNNVKTLWIDLFFNNYLLSVTI